MKDNSNFKSLFRTSLVALCLLTMGIGDVWATTVYYVNRNSWGGVKIHYWGGSNGSNWDTRPSMNKLAYTVNGFDVYSYDIGNNTTVIFMDSSNDSNRDGGDVSFSDSSKPYYFNGWYASFAACWQVKGGYDSWAGTTCTSTGNNTGRVTVNLTADTDFKLYCLANSNWYGSNGGTIPDNTSWTLDGSENTTLAHTHDGDYVLDINFSGSKPSVTTHAPYQVTYAAGANGSGSVSASSVTTYGTNCTLSSSTFSRAGYTQDGWSTSDGGSKAYNLGGTYSAYTDITLYPHWTANTYTVTLNREGGTMGSTTVTATYNAAMPAITLPTYTGKKFEGYYTGQNGTGTQYYAYNGNSVHTCDFTSNPTLYANWKTPTEYTFYYAAPSDVVANNTVKCHVNYGYDQGSADVNMTATNKTYNNKRIYSVTVTANYESFDAIYFKPKGISGAGNGEQAANTSYVAASTINGKIYEHGVGWQTYAEDAEYTLYFVNYYDWATPKAYAWSSDYDKSCEYASSQAMTKTAYTYNGHDIYTITYSRGFTNVIFNNNASDVSKTGNLDCYANRGKLYNGSSWQAYGRDITVYVVPEAIGYTSGTTYDPSTHNSRANVKVSDDEWLASWPIFTKTSYKYKSHWIYEARVLAKYNVIKTIQFWVFSGDDKVANDSYYDCSPASQYVASDIDGKIFVGYDTDHHRWDAYGLDVELDQQSGSAGTESVTSVAVVVN